LLSSRTVFFARIMRDPDVTQKPLFFDFTSPLK
jgi:hypothetical protein